MGAYNTIEYVTIATTSNATDFGDLTEAKYETGTCTDGTYAVVGGGRNLGRTFLNVIEYITIQTTGNGTDFGDLTVTRNQADATAGN